MEATKLLEEEATVVAATQREDYILYIHFFSEMKNNGTGFHSSKETTPKSPCKTVNEKARSQKVSKGIRMVLAQYHS